MLIRHIQASFWLKSSLISKIWFFLNVDQVYYLSYVNSKKCRAYLNLCLRNTTMYTYNSWRVKYRCDMPVTNKYLNRKVKLIVIHGTNTYTTNAFKLRSGICFHVYIYWYRLSVPHFLFEQLIKQLSTPNVVISFDQVLYYTGFIVMADWGSLLCLVAVCMADLVSYASTKKYAGQVLLVSMDGFRWDYINKTQTPNFDRMARLGTHALYMNNTFITKTFPNHYTLVTGKSFYFQIV